MKPLSSFVAFAISKGYEALLDNDTVLITNVKNPGNDFKIMKSEGVYGVFTIRVSQLDYEYLAKCLVYVLLAEYNKSNSTSTHLHLDFKVQL